MLLMRPNYIHKKVETLFKVIFKHFLISFDVSNQFTPSMKTGAPIRLDKGHLAHFVCGRFCNKEQSGGKMEISSCSRKAGGRRYKCSAPELELSPCTLGTLLFSTLGGAGAITIYSGNPRSFQT